MIRCQWCPNPATGRTSAGWAICNPCWDRGADMDPPTAPDDSCRCPGGIPDESTRCPQWRRVADGWAHNLRPGSAVVVVAANAPTRYRRVEEANR